MKKVLDTVWKYLVALGEARYQFAKRNGFRTGY